MKRIVFHGVALIMGISMVSHAVAQYGQNSWGGSIPGSQTRAPYPPANLSSPVQRQMQPALPGFGTPSQIQNAPRLSPPTQNGLIPGTPTQYGTIQNRGPAQLQGQIQHGRPIQHGHSIQQGKTVQPLPGQQIIHPPHVNQNYTPPAYKPAPRYQPSPTYHQAPTYQQRQAPTYQQQQAPAYPPVPPTPSAPAYGQAPAHAGGGCAPAANCGSVNCGGSCGGGVYGATGGGCASVYGDSCGVAAPIAKNRNANWIFGIYGIGFLRDYEDDIILSYNPVGDVLASTSADNGLMGGFETMIGRRGCNGAGWEARYWGLYPGQSSATILNATTSLRDFQFITDPTSGFDAYNIFNTSNDHRVYRDNQFHNVELNLLGNAGCNGSRSYEWIAGFRWFEFDEYFQYSAFNTAGGYPPRYDYNIDVSNTLLGFQMGGRKEICCGSKFRLHLGGRAGVFNNHIRSRQFFVNDTGVYGQLNAGGGAGNDYDYTSTKNDLAVLGELDLGMSYQFSCCARVRAGYRVIGISGVALAPNQIPRNFTDTMDLQRIKSNGGLILHGFYVGGEFCF